MDSEQRFGGLADRYRVLTAGVATPAVANEERAACEEHLLRHVRDRSRDGREALWLLLWAALPEVVCFIQGRVDDPHETDELAQRVLEAVLKAYDRGSSLRLENGRASLYAYVFRATRLELSRHFERRAHRAEVLSAPEDLDLIPDPGGRSDDGPATITFQLGNEEFWHWARQALRLLPRRDYDLVYLSYREELSGAELARAAGIPEHTNVSVPKARAYRRFLDRFAVVWVARTMLVAPGETSSGCPTLMDLLGPGWLPDRPDSFSDNVYRAVKGHTAHCAACAQAYGEIAQARTGGAILAKFRTLPLAPASAALRRWWDQQQRPSDEHRRRTVIEILGSRRAPGTDTGLTAAGEGSAAVGRTAPVVAFASVVHRGVERLRDTVVGFTRLPAVAGLVQAAQQNPGLTAGGGIAVLAIAGLVTLGANQPGPAAVAARPRAAHLTPQGQAASGPVLSRTSTSTPTPSPTSGPSDSPAPTTSSGRPVPTSGTGRQTGSTTPASTPPLSPPPGTPRHRDDPGSSPAATPRAGGDTAPGAKPSTPSCTPTWQAVAGPDTGGASTRGWSGAATGPSDIWALEESKAPGIKRAWFGHYDGVAWTVIPSPNPGNQVNELDRITAIGPRDAWATLRWKDDNAPYQSELLHWNGSTWAATSPPVPNGFGISLSGIAALAADDIWAVGDSSSTPDGTKSQALTLHWNGAAWTVVPAVNPFPVYNPLWAVAGSGPTDVWAVGGEYGDTGVIIEHWDGTNWTLVPSPSPPRARNAFLMSVAVLRPDDAWAAGVWTDDAEGEHALVLHWDGRRWAIVPAPDLGGETSYLASIAIVNEHEVWLVGKIGHVWSGQQLVEYGRPLTLRWNGTTLTVASPPSAALAGGVLGGVLRVGAHDLWSFGFVHHPDGNETDLIQRLCVP